MMESYNNIFRKFYFDLSFPKVGLNPILVSHVKLSVKLMVEKLHFIGGFFGSGTYKKGASMV